MNTLQNAYEIYEFTLTVSLSVAMVSAVRNDRDQRLLAVHLIELVVCNFHRKSSNVCLFNFRYGISFYEQKRCRFACRFWSKFYLQNSAYFHTT